MVYLGDICSQTVAEKMENVRKVRKGKNINKQN
jgi:hypothetical protein